MQAKNWLKALISKWIFNGLFWFTKWIGAKKKSPYQKRTVAGYGRLRSWRPRLDELEPRVTPTGNITITNALVVDGNNNPLPAVTAGEWVYVQADFTTQNLPSNASYRVALTVNGLTLDSGYITWGAGNSGTGNWDLYWGTFLATPGTNQAFATVDPDHSVAETSYADNSFSFTFNAAGAPAGTFISYTAAQMRNAYGVNSIPSFGAAAPDGSGQTIAIINGGNDPTLFADVNGFDQAMSLTPNSTQTISQRYGAASSFLTVYNQNGVNITPYIANSGSNGVPPLPTGSEESWDVEWAHAMAPGAKIDEIEFDPTGNWGANLLTSYATAATLPGVSAANWSGGLSQWSTESSYDTSVFVTPSGHVGVTFVCPSNDNGANVYPSYGQGDGYYPSTSPNVVSIGGTHLNLNNDGYGSETGWSYPTPTTTVDNGSASYSQTGTWSPQVNGFSGAYSTATAGSSSTATWTIPISPANTGWGTELSATWNASSGNATNATYTVYDGTAATGTVLGTIPLNQTRAPAGTADGSAQFQELGVFFPTLNANGAGTLTVVLNAGSANGTVVADAISAAPAWASTGGPALSESEPAYQKPFQSTGYRTTPDVSFDADFSADGYGGGGITYGGGGTSLGGPCWTGLFAIVNQGRVAAGGTSFNSPSNPQQTLQALYSLPASDFHDITTGYNGFSAESGYDFVTGRGTPITNTLIPALVSYGLTPVATTTTESTSAPSVVYGNSVTFRASVTAGSGTSAPSQGNVDFIDTSTNKDLGNGTFVGSSGVVSTWTITVTANNNPNLFKVTAGDNIRVTFVPGKGFTGSSGTVSQAVTALPITVTAATNTKFYDGTTAAAAMPTITSGSLAAGDTAAFTESYDTANAGTGKTLTPSGSVNDGNGGNNYAVTFIPDIAGAIIGIDHFRIMSTAADPTAGVPFGLGITALDANGNVLNYNGSITLTSNDPLVPADGTVSSQGGFAVAAVTLDTATTSTITVSGGGATDNVSFAVNPGPTSQFIFNPGTVPSSILTGMAFSPTITAEDAFGNVTASYTGTVHFTSTDPLATIAAGYLPANYTFTGSGHDNGVHTFTNGVTLLTPGSQTITVSDTSHAAITGASSAIAAVGLQVTSVVGNPTGFTVNFNKPFDPSSLKLYGATLNNPGLLFYMTNVNVGPTELTGSVVPNANDTAFTIVETNFGDQNGGLPNGVYDVSILSSANGVKDMTGTPLDASNNQNASPNLYSTLLGQAVTAYSTSFTLSTMSAFTDTTQSTPTQVAVSLPAFAQGPGLPVDVQVHNSGGVGGTFPGIPATISDGDNASTVSFSVTYNAALLTVTGGVVDPSILASHPRATFSRTATGTPVGGLETDNFTFSTGDGSLLKTGSTWTLGDITASVPNAPGQQIYKSKQLLTLSNITSDGTVTNLVGGNGFEVVAYLGDTSGDGNIQLNDATIANNVGNPAIGGGFPAYTKVDPVVLADTDGAGFVDSSSVGNIASLAIGHGQPTIPTPPQGRITSSGGADPDLSLPAQLKAADGVVEVPVNLDNAMPAGSTGLAEATLDLVYNPRVLTMSGADVHLGSLPSLGTGWTVTSVVNQAAGQLVIQLYSLTPLTVSASGSLVTVSFHMQPGATGTGGVSLVDWANPTGQAWFRTSLSDTNGALTLGNSTGRAVVSGEGRVASGESSMSAAATNAINPTENANSEPDAQARVIVESLAGPSGSVGEVVFQRTGPSGVPSDPAIAGVFQFGNAALINVPGLVTPFQLLTAEVFSELGTDNGTDLCSLLENMRKDVSPLVLGQTRDRETSLVNGEALDEVFAQLGLD